MSIDRTAALTAALLLAVTSASADSLSERRAAKEKSETVEVEVACGKLDKENCAAVVPEVTPAGWRFRNGPPSRRRSG